MTFANELADDLGDDLATEPPMPLPVRPRTEFLVPPSVQLPTRRNVGRWHSERGARGVLAVLVAFAIVASMSLAVVARAQDSELSSPPADEASPMDELVLPDQYLDPAWPEFERPYAFEEKNEPKSDYDGAGGGVLDEGDAKDTPEQEDAARAELERKLTREFWKDHWDEDFHDREGNPTAEWDQEYRDPDEW
jgi:hypothetical protein